MLLLLANQMPGIRHRMHRPLLSLTSDILRTLVFPRFLPSSSLLRDTFGIIKIQYEVLRDINFNSMPFSAYGANSLH